MSTPCFASVIISCAFASEIFMSFCIFFTSRSCRKGALASAVFARHACAATSRYASSGGISNSLTSMSIFLCISGSCWWIACSSMCFELARGRYFPLQPMELCCCCCEVGPSDLERVATMGRAGAGIDVALGRSPNDTTGFLSAHLWSRSVGSRSISRRRRSALCSSLTRSVPRLRPSRPAPWCDDAATAGSTNAAPIASATEPPFLSSRWRRAPIEPLSPFMTFMPLTLPLNFLTLLTPNGLKLIRELSLKRRRAPASADLLAVELLVPRPLLPCSESSGLLLMVRK
mmetsp:Transcript_29678/g.72872  ORF Transcript_29678/g.72872 Transcript_29678/m.72872 type:complete len:288 (-) Transcript_29678:2558-3421(-)